MPLRGRNSATVVSKIALLGTCRSRAGSDPGTPFGTWRIRAEA
jgi:hypothetical protein